MMRRPTPPQPQKLPERPKLQISCEEFSIPMKDRKMWKILIALFVVIAVFLAYVADQTSKVIKREEAALLVPAVQKVTPPPGIVRRVEQYNDNYRVETSWLKNPDRVCTSLIPDSANSSRSSSISCILTEKVN